MTNKKFQCIHCSKEFKYDSERKRHEQSHDPQFQCKVCEKNFSFISALRRHEKQHERTGKVQCNDCGRQFRDNNLLNRHIKYAHSGSYTCTKCDLTFNSDIALRSHMKSHKVAMERKYQCRFDGCNKKFNFSHHLKHHELAHTNSKQFYCKICGKGFIQAHNFKTHIKTHLDDQSLYCEFPGCNKKFATEQSKKRHQINSHKIIKNKSSSESNCSTDHSLVDGAVPYSKPVQEINVKEYNALVLNSTENLKETERDNVNLYEDSNIEGNFKKNILKLEENQTSRNCEAVIGSCIMKDKDETCVCAQIPEANVDDCDFKVIEKEPIKVDKLKLNANPCEGCECSGCFDGINSEEEPIIEYADGAVKVKVTFDMDFSMQPVAKNEVNSIPMNSCKAVLGNCIVSGDGSINEGCLCARMAMDNQVNAQEIDDITPHPKKHYSLCQL